MEEFTAIFSNWKPLRDELSSRVSDGHITEPSFSHQVFEIAPFHRSIYVKYHVNIYFPYTYI